MLDFDFCSIDDILRNRKSIRRELSASDGLRELRIAVLGGSTTNEFVNLLEILLLASHFRPVFYQSEYGRFYEDAVYDPQTLIDFKPDLVYIHTSNRNIQNYPPLNCSEEQLAGCVASELERFQEIWSALDANVHCQIVQNNFEVSAYSFLGSLDASSSGGRGRFLSELNVAFAKAIAERSNTILQDIHSISAHVGLKRWFDWSRYFSYKLLYTAEANLEIARSLNAIVKAIYGKKRKVLVLDLDNTLWGGVIGDDGVDGLQLGRETPMGEAFIEFQEYCLGLRDRGVLLAVCSKNNDETARAGFMHPSSILKLEHISSFKANWDPKHENIRSIALELNLGLDSFVFIDDNPAEREIVRAQIPEVAVPDVGNDPVRYPAIIEAGRFFESISLSKEDLARATLYAQNSKRSVQAQKFSDYGEYLDSLEMIAEISTFKPVYLERIAQLTNKTNQFNLTTLRLSFSEIEAFSSDPAYIPLYGKLVDRFGDNGLISVVIGRIENTVLYVDLWLMSCRVLKRDMELAMLDALVEKANSHKLESIVGYYIPTSKNTMVENFYQGLGFEPDTGEGMEYPDKRTVWRLNLAGYTKRNTHSKTKEYGNA
ncbi:HAD-IIIC family phosphatase [Granulicella tundricola]|uniref:FkbH like protein n=1 Tax=Granulicella tundricola (strain ATCC BAA-1859 / DSM 23138 / MP5ACTX9) TaxID=1198114 RepID=E8X528_GRATM|nr:HAD-IIIC family phosphatase [Granulicella tundricola]ADW67220.1 FkbH like protein [Granulicella tundricola MP5ACTX9]